MWVREFKETLFYAASFLFLNAFLFSVSFIDSHCGLKKNFWHISYHVIVIVISWYIIVLPSVYRKLDIGHADWDAGSQTSVRSFKHQVSFIHSLHGLVLLWNGKPAILYGIECWAVTIQPKNKLNVTEMGMLRWMSGH